MSPPGLIVAAPASGAGKTMFTLGLLAALRARGLRVHPFKNGPDYIDPAFHRAASGLPSYNLDTWAMPAALLRGLAERADGCDLIVAEASMGLFDGVAAAGAVGTGASADLATFFGWPVVLVLDVSGQAQSAAAVAKGFATLRPDMPFAGVVLNKVASARHEALARAGMREARIPVFGALPRREAIALPSRHLGLVQAQEQAGLDAIIAEAGRFVAAHVDIDAIVAAAACRPPPSPALPSRALRLPPPGQRIALARDAAFSFVYPHLIEGWRGAGAEIIPFSPLADEAPDPSADCCWLPGGYPELHGGQLAAATHFQDGLRRFADSRPAHGECGGYMALGAALIDADGVAHRMAGLLGVVTSFARRRMHLGYRRARLHAPMPGYAPGAVLRGHVFHYATVLEQPDPPLADIVDANGEAVAEGGSRRGRATGTFFHLVSPDLDA